MLEAEDLTKRYGGVRAGREAGGPGAGTRNPGHSKAVKGEPHP